MPLGGINGPSNITGPFRSKAVPAAQPDEPPAGAQAPAAPSDRVRFHAPGSSSEIRLDDVAPKKASDFDVSDASERLIASHGGDLEQAYFESLEMRNTSKNAPSYPDKLAAYSHKLGLQRNLTADEMRDIEHFMFAAASVAEKAQAPKGADMLDRSLAVLKREPHAVAMGVLTVGYTAAKAVNNLLPKELKFLKSRTDPSLDELGAGLKGTFRGLKDKV